MAKAKQKIKLSENLKMGISGPASQSTFFKVGGVFFLVLSLILVINIYREMKSAPISAINAASTAADQKVLGAFDQRAPVPIVTNTYTVQNGDTLFNIAQAKSLDWQTIATLNNMKPPYALKLGQQLKLPQGQ